MRVSPAAPGYAGKIPEILIPLVLGFVFTAFEDRALAYQVRSPLCHSLSVATGTPTKSRGGAAAEWPLHALPLTLSLSVAIGTPTTRRGGCRRMTLIL